MNQVLKSHVESFVNGDKTAYEYIFKEEYAKVYARVKTNIYFENEQDIEDVVQDSFIKAYEKIDTLKDVNNFESWLMMIAINTAKNEIIKRNKTSFFAELPDGEGMTQENLLENPYIEFQPEQQMARRELEQNLFDILSKIPLQQSLCLQLKEYDGLSYQEIADTLEIPLSSVKNNIFYAKKKIKAEVEARKLYSVAPITFFLWMYRTYVDAAEVPVEIQNAAWITQQKALFALRQLSPASVSANASTLAKTAGASAIKTGVKLTAMRIVAVIGTVAVLGVAGFSVSSVIHSENAEEILTVSDGSDEETVDDDVPAENSKFSRVDYSNEEENSLDSAVSERAPEVVTPTERDMEMLKELVEFTMEWMGDSRSNLGKYELQYMIDAIVCSEGNVVESDPKNYKKTVDSIKYVYSVDTDIVLELLKKNWGRDITFEELQDIDINEAEYEAFQYYYDGKIYTRPLIYEAMMTFTTIEFQKIASEGDRFTYEANYAEEIEEADIVWDAGNAYIVASLYEGDSGRYWTVYDWDNKKIEREDETKYSIDNVYFGTSGFLEVYWGDKKAQTGICDKKVMHYTIDGVEHEIDYSENGLNPFPGAGFEMGYQIVDLTNDGQDELVVSEYVYGNTYHELLQTTHVYEIDMLTKELHEILSIGYDQAERFVPGFPYNLGISFEGNKAVLDVGTKKESQEMEFSRVYLYYDGEAWLAQQYAG